MIDQNPIRTARRKARRLDQGRCILCGRTGVLIEMDHIAGQNHDPDLTGPLCRSCHALITEFRIRAGAEMTEQGKPAERVRAALKSAAVFMHEFAEAMRRWADWL
jgi:hypothetical protein